MTKLTLCYSFVRAGHICEWINERMKNFNRHSSLGHHGSKSKHRELAQYAHSHGSHAFTHTLTSTVTTMWCKAPAQLLPFSVCWVFSCFHNPTHSDVDYRIFIVCTWSFWCVRMHTWVGHTDSESAHFWLGKTHNFFLCSWRGSNLSPLDLEFDALPIEPPIIICAVQLWVYTDRLAFGLHTVVLQLYCCHSIAKFSLRVCLFVCLLKAYSPLFLLVFYTWSYGTANVML